MQSRMRTAIVLLTLAGVTGVWLVVAPFIAGYQPTGDPWITATTRHVATGTVLVAASLAAVLAIIGGALRALGTADDITPASTAPGQSPPGGRRGHEEHG